MDDRAQFEAWLKDHNDQFVIEDYSVADIVNYAIACGFNHETVKEWFQRVRAKTRVTRK